MDFSYAADRADFDVPVTLSGVDSENDLIPDIQIPTGTTLKCVSSDTSALSVTQDESNPKLFHFHVESPNAGGSVKPVDITLSLTKDDDGSDVVPPIVKSGEVVPGAAVGATALGFTLPAA